MQWDRQVLSNYRKCGHSQKLIDVHVSPHLLITGTFLLFIWIGGIGSHVMLSPPTSSRGVMRSSTARWLQRLLGLPWPSSQLDINKNTSRGRSLATVLTRHLDHLRLLLSTWRLRCQNSSCVHTFQIFIPNDQCYPQHPGKNTCKPYLHRKIPLLIPMPVEEADFRLTKRISKAFRTASEILFEAAAQLKIKYINFGGWMWKIP